MFRIICILVIILGSLSTCKKKEIGPQCPSCQQEIQVATQEVLIGCEGNFGWGNASLSLYDPKEETVQQNIYQNVNQVALGDVAQSVELINGDLYVVVNNSGKVEVLDTSNYMRKTTITGLVSPREICAVSNTKAYVSDLYEGKITIVDLVGNVTQGNIEIGRWTETLFWDGNNMLVACPDTNFVLLIDPANDIIKDTVVLGYAPNSIEMDANGNLWVLCSGKSGESFPELYQLGVDYQIIKTFTFQGINQPPGYLKMNANRDRLYFLSNGVFSMPIDAVSLPEAPIINEGSNLFYGLGIDPGNSDIYVADALDYVQAGLVNRYDSMGNLKDQFNVGVIPQFFWFK